MRKLILLCLFIISGYKAYQHFAAAYDKGPVAADGTPIAQLFVADGCGVYCDEMEEILQSRNINYQLIDINTPEGKKFGIYEYPLTRVGKHKIVGNRRNELIGALAETFGESVLTSSERMAMEGHFDEAGKPLIVLYGSQGCGYCKREREYFAEHNIAFEDLDVEADPSAKLSFDALGGYGYPLTYVGYRRFDGGYKEKLIEKAAAELQ